ncbi:MAG: protein kinase, partial [Vicinamibacteria bacterium]|nr:protein kinase [Vicinamibacteria bacterium]
MARDEPLASDSTLDSDATRAVPPSGSGGLRGIYVPLFEAGQLVAERYLIIRYLARGGMGEVFEAEDKDLGGRVALKVVRGEMAQDEGAINRFKREIHLARKVSHPNVCRIFDLGRHRVTRPDGAGTDDILFLTMELLDGETLRDRVRRKGRLPLAEALPIARQLASGLATAHEEGIVHRDFKSPNVMLVPGISGERAVITDFGLARVALDARGVMSMTGSGDVLGTPAYMAPEQLKSGKVGPAADIYALGIVLFEMVTGELPFKGDSAISIAIKRLTEAPESPRQIVADLDPAWEAVILRCLEREPTDRFASAHEVGAALEPRPGPEPPPLKREVTSAAAARGPMRPLALAGLVAAVVAVAGIATWSRRTTEPPGPDAVPGTSASGRPEAAPVRLRQAVAVLGFKNLGRPEAAWLSTAIAEMLRTELAAGGKLRSVPGESVARMRIDLQLADTDSLARDTLQRVRANCGADFVVLGSYLAVGKGRVRLDLRLQDTERGEILASAPAEATEEEIFSLVSEAGSKLRAALGVGALSELDARAVRATFPSNPAAAQAYSEGLAKLSVFDALEARRLFDTAIAAEPGHPLPHSALARAWSALGYDEKAKAAAKRANELSQGLPREDRLAVEAQYHETMADWPRAVETYRALQVFFPDRLDYGLSLAAALTAAGQGQEALDSIKALRRLPKPAAEDPRIDLAEAAAAKALTDFEQQHRSAVAAAHKAEKQGALLVLGQARLAEGTALVNLGRLPEARQACARSGEIFAAAGDHAGVARSENIVAVAFARSGDFPQARVRFEAALRSFREMGDQRGIALQLGNVAGVLVELGKLPEAKKLYEQSLAVAREVADKSQVARALNNLGS